MKLSLLSEASLILEGYGLVAQTKYSNYNIDPRPKVLKLGTWIHPNTGNVLVGGINLNYLRPEQIQKVQYYLPEILKNRNLRRRYWTGRRLVPDVFDDFYRTYNQRYIDVVDTDTLRFMTPKEIENLGDAERADKLRKRREALSLFKKEPSKVRVPMREPLPSELPPEKEPLPERPEGEVAQMAKAAVDAKRTKKITPRLADKIRQELEKTEAPGKEPEVPEPETPALEPGEEPEVEPEEPEPGLPGK
jgi:hypothetical protein